MKKFFAATAALLLFPVWSFCQETMEESDPFEATLVTRAEYSSFDGDNHYLGNSSFYALLDGEFGGRFYYSSELHLLSSNPASLYRNTFKSGSGNWLDWAYLGVSLGSFDITAGKIAIPIGTMEFDAYDFDSYYETASYLWNECNCYQWGADLSYMPFDGFTIKGAFSTSQHGEYFFKSRLYTYSAFLGYDNDGWYAGRLSFNAMKSGDPAAGATSFSNLLCTGHRFTFGQFSATLDAAFIKTEHTGFDTTLSLTYSPVDKFSATIKGGYDRNLPGAYWNEEEFVPDNIFYGGLVVNYLPIESLRIHTILGYNDSFCFNLGLTWKISL